MIIEKLELHEYFVDNIDTFSSKRNLIHSSRNTKGKTTYLRLLFYALGYPIPNMRGIKNEDIITKITFLEKNIKYTAIREKNCLTLLYDENTLEFTLPSQHLLFLSQIFQYNNFKVLNNLLGIIYVDQEKGWTLLNRGIVIGKNRFSIEELLAGLNNVDIDELIEKQKKLKLNKEKYSTMLNVQELKERVIEDNGEIFFDDTEKELNTKISYYRLKIKNETDALNEINDVLNKDKKFYDFIDSMNLSVKQEDVIIPVNRKTLLYSKENFDFLNARKNIIAINIERLKSEKKNYEIKLKEYLETNAQTNLFDSEADNNIIEKQLANLNIDQVALESLIEDNNLKLKNIKTEIKNNIEINNSYITKIFNYVYDFAVQLEVDDKIINKEDFIFTSDLKSLSGGVLQKIVFAFKVAFLKVVEEEMNTKLFMVLDSPKGRELDDHNMKLIEKLIENQLPDNQIFFASIYKLKNEKTIRIKKMAIEGRNN
ncbi:MAG: hypothetical protein SPE24_07845 [Erysipelotrichaceae bacterium]|nr:hypothetical protein [Erysipelotrichaceae bacterium]